MQSVNQISIGGLFSGNEHYEIPLYQRPYSWGQGHVQSLLTDFHEILDQEDDSHMIGMVVLCKHPEKKASYDIIDGQQRLTTILIMISWIRDRMFDLFEHENAPGSNNPHLGFAWTLNNLIFNDAKKSVRFSTKNESHLEKEFLQLILSPLNSITVEQFKNIGKYQSQHNETTDNEKNTAEIKQSIFRDKHFNQTRAKAKRAVKNFKYLSSEFELKLEKYDTVSDQIEFLSRYGKALLDRLTCIPLVVSDYSKAFKMFETMNDRGLSVSALDLVKNEALQQGNGKKERETIHEGWKEIFVQNLKNSNSPLSFLRYAHNARESFATKNGLFHSYKSIFEGGFVAVDSELRDLNEFSLIYNGYLERDWPEETPLRDHLVKLKTTKTYQWTSLGMVLSSIYEKNPVGYHEVIERAFHVMYALVFTQLLRGLGANTFEQFFPEVARELWSARNSPSLDDRLNATVKKLMKKLNSIGIPTEEDLKTKEITSNTLGANACYVLKLMDLQHGGSIRTDFTLEHVYPQKAQSNQWPSFVVDEDEEIDRNSCYNFGNFILLLKGLNASASNASFSTKRAKYIGNEKSNPVFDSIKTINPELAYDNVSEWTPDIISQRNDLICTTLHKQIYGAFHES